MSDTERHNETMLELQERLDRTPIATMAEAFYALASFSDLANEAGHYLGRLRALERAVHELTCIAPETCSGTKCAVCAVKATVPCHTTKEECDASTQRDIDFFEGRGAQ